jgi:hypothetical protein
MRCHIRAWNRHNTPYEILTGSGAIQSYPVTNGSYPHVKDASTGANGPIVLPAHSDERRMWLDFDPPGGAPPFGNSVFPGVQSRTRLVESGQCGETGCSLPWALTFLFSIIYERTRFWQRNCSVVVGQLQYAPRRIGHEGRWFCAPFRSVSFHFISHSVLGTVRMSRAKWGLRPAFLINQLEIDP